MEKYVIKCGIMRGTGIKGKKGDVLELNSKSESVQDLVKRGWIEKVEAEKVETEKVEKAKEKAPKKEPKKEPNKK